MGSLLAVSVGPGNWPLTTNMLLLVPSGASVASLTVNAYFTVTPVFAVSRVPISIILRRYYQRS
jgi:hypothetical protein